jgi:hypothetical protein
MSSDLVETFTGGLPTYQSTEYEVAGRSDDFEKNVLRIRPDGWTDSSVRLCAQQHFFSSPRIWLKLLQAVCPHVKAPVIKLQPDPTTFEKKVLPRVVDH